MRQATADACGFVAGLSKSEFLSDKRTQQAVILKIVIIGEAATKLLNENPEFTERFPEVPWRNMRGMRNRIAHGYFDIDLEIVWETGKKSLPELSELLENIRPNAGG